MSRQYPLFEYDDTVPAVIDPTQVLQPIKGIAQHAVLCFFQMEGAAFFAVAQFRGCVFGQILYGGDNVAAEQWDSCAWQGHVSVREQLFWVAAEACLAIGELP